MRLHPPAPLRFLTGESVDDDVVDIGRTRLAIADVPARVDERAGERLRKRVDRTTTGQAGGQSSPRLETLGGAAEATASRCAHTDRADEATPATDRIFARQTAASGAPTTSAKRHVLFHPGPMRAKSRRPVCQPHARGRSTRCGASREVSVAGADAQCWREGNVPRSVTSLALVAPSPARVRARAPLGAHLP